MAGFFTKMINKIAGVEEVDEGIRNWEDEGDMGEFGEEGYVNDMDPVDEVVDYGSEPVYVPTEEARTAFPIKSVQPSSNQVVILQPDSIRSSQAVCDHIRQGHTVICNIENVERSVAQRVIDYISGAAYSIDGNVKPIDQNRKTFVVAPRSVSLLDRDALAKQEEAQNQQQAYRQAL